MHLVKDQWQRKLKGGEQCHKIIVLDRNKYVQENICVRGL